MWFLRSLPTISILLCVAWVWAFYPMPGGAVNTASWLQALRVTQRRPKPWWARVPLLSFGVAGCFLCGLGCSVYFGHQGNTLGVIASFFVSLWIVLASLAYRAKPL